MSPFASLLVPLDGSHAAARGLRCAVWLANNLKANLHILSATPRSLSAREELTRLRVPEAYWPRIILHQAPRFPEEAILSAVSQHGVDLIVMSAQGEAADTAVPTDTPAPLAVVGHVTRVVIEQSGVPVLLLPPAYRDALPWKHVLVPMSGEVEADEVLTLAVSLANALALKLHVVHVLQLATAEGGLASVARYADAVHHEYPQRLAELVRRTLPHFAPEECHCIENVALARGDVTTELLEQIEKRHIGLVVVGWHGRFMTGRAAVLKALLASMTCPMLLVKPAHAAPFRLKVGLDID